MKQIQFAWAIQLFFNNQNSTIVGNIITYNWSFGDPNSGANNFSTLENPTHFYAIPGVYIVTLIITDDLGCSNQYQKSIVINPLPNASFQASETSCTNDTTWFTDYSSAQVGSVVEWFWDFGNGQNSTLQNPYQVFEGGLGDTTYLVNLTVWDDSGCSDTLSQIVNVFGLPTANFLVEDNCFGQNTVFTDLSTSASGTIISWEWSFGDGTFSALQNPIHLYNSTGDFTIQLISTTSNGCSDTTSQQHTIFPLPEPNFTEDIGCVLDSTYFTDLSVAEVDIISWNWAFGDPNSGANNFSTLENPTHFYAIPGVYIVTLIITDDLGCSNQYQKSIVINPLPNASFQASETSCTNDTTWFTDYSSAQVGSVVEWFWDFGNGQNSTLQNPYQVFEGGIGDTTYLVNLTVWDDSGCSDTLSQIVNVFGLPTAEFLVEDNCFGQNTVFTDLSTSASGTIISWEWSFGDGTFSALQNPIHLYNSTGDFSIQLISTTSNGCSDTTFQQHTIFPLPEPNFTEDIGCVLDTTYFTDLSVAEVDIISWNWDFGDPNSGANNFSTLENPTHFYAIPGVYIVTLIITDDLGCSNQYQKSIVINPLPNASFQASETSCTNDTTWFTDYSSAQVGSVVEWFWDFGNGQNSTLQNPYQVFEGGIGDTTYLVNLTVWDDSGCSDTLSQIVNVFGLPTAEFLVEDNCFGQNTVFTDLSTSASGTIISWEWSFGDGTFSALQNPIHLYNSTGDFSIQLISTTSNGCSDTTFQQHTIFPLPEPNFTVDTVCFNDSTYFFDETISGADIISWSWDFGDPESGDENFSSLQHPSHKFSNWGTFEVKLVVINNNNCSDSITLPIFIRPLPIADFIVENGTCSDIPVSFLDATSFVMSDPYSWTWNFGDGNEQTIFAPETPNISHIYENSGFFDVLLTVENNFGCTDSIMQIIEILTKPEAGFIWHDSLCTSGYVQFVDTSMSLGGDIISREWYPEYPNSAFLTGEEPTYIYGTTDTTYVAMLIITSAAGCRDTVYDSIFVKDPFSIDFTASEECEGFATSFFVEIITPDSDSIISYLWNFGDNTTSELPNPEHLYAVGGQYTVWVQATNIYGCLSQISKTISVKDKPNAAFTVLPEGCSDLSCFEDNTLFNGAEPFHWYYDFGDGTDTNLWAANGGGSLFHEYPNYAANWPVMLVVENTLGCSDTVYGVAERYECLTADFIQINSTCGNRPTFFENTSSVYGDNTEVTQTVWHYGDGSFDSFSYFKDTVSHIYDFAGTYNLHLVVVAESNGVIIQDSIIKIIEVKSTPNAEFSFNLGCEGSPVDFTNNSDPVNSAILSSQWFFGDGYTSATHSPNHIFTEEGEYETSLVVVSMEGCSDTVSHQVVVHPAAEIFLSVDKEIGCNGYASFSLKDTTSQEKSYYHWGLGSGQFVTTSEDTISTYLHTGDYTLSLEVETDLGCKAFDTASVSVFESPEALFTHYPDSVSIQDSVISFYDNSISLDGSIEHYFWKFDDYGTAYGDQIEWKFPDTGWYKVTEFITTEHGCSDSVSKMVRVYPQFYCWIPNAFTPNGDGRNDKFFPVLTFSSPESYAFTVFDKWGGVLYNSNTVGDSWNGRNQNGKRCPAGAYAYLILVTDPYHKKRVYKGSFTLVR